MIAVEEEEDCQTKTVSLANVAGTKQLEEDFGRVHLELKQPSQKLKHVVFDMSVVDPLRTNAPRVFEMVKEWQHRFKKKRISVRMKMPRLIYDDLQRTERRLPVIKKGSARYAGIGIEIIDALDRATSATDVALLQLADRRDELCKKQEIILSCMGKVRELTDNKVIVSLFAPEGEIIGDFGINQFPEGSVQVGRIFSYQASIKEAGVTETTVQWMPERDLSAEEIDEIDRFVDSALPPEPFARRAD